MFDSAALAVLLKAAIAVEGSVVGNVTITSPDGSRVFSQCVRMVCDPLFDALSCSQIKPSTFFTSPNLATSGESEEKLSEEEKKKPEKIQQIRVKFLRVVHSLGHSLDDSTAANALHRTALIAGRQTNGSFSL